MKSILIGFIATFFCSFSFAQSNNPYNQVGDDYVTSFFKIKNDYEAGTLRDVSQATLNSYKELLPFKGDATEEMAREILTIVRDTTTLINDRINNSNLSAYFKQSLISIVENIKTLHKEEYMQFLTEKVEVWKNTTDITEEEKESLLSFTAISYNMTNSSQSLRTNGNDNDGDALEDWLIGAATGFVVGHIVCGWICAGGGAIIGGIVGILVGPLS